MWRFSVLRTSLLPNGWKKIPSIPLAICSSRTRFYATATASQSRTFHLLLYHYVDDAVNLRKPYRQAHLDLAQLAVGRGELLLGGALAQPVDGGILVFDGDAEMAKSFAERDPYVQNGIVTDWHVREWTVVAGALLPLLSPAPPLELSYEWQTVHGDMEIPPGLEIELPLNGQPKRARIPPRWRLQVWLDERRGYLRHDVQRDTTVGELRRAAATSAGVPMDAVKVYMGEDTHPLSDPVTIEALRLFGREAQLVIVIDNVGKAD
mmetsp:Transcript_2061/g.6453  ORF Transcript_2061/g.6453 Transcript_2061/m.6453 type:complete len:264 (+) Transcript_2061:184-975(+)